MFEKIDIRRIIAGHLATLSDYRDAKPSAADRLLFFAVPLVAALAAWWFGFHLNAIAVNGLLTAFSIFAGLLLSLLVMVLGFVQAPTTSTNEQMMSARKRLLREIVANISFSILIASGIVVLCILALSIVTDDKAPIAPGYVFMIVAGTINFLFDMLMILKRMYALMVLPWGVHATE